MRLRFIIIFIYLVIALAILCYLVSNLIKSSEGHSEAVVEAYRARNFSGLIVDKYIDRKQHSYEKIVINENNQERVIIFNPEKGGLFNFLEVGDSIIKTEGNLKVLVIREDTDTIINMRFTNI